MIKMRMNKRFERRSIVREDLPWFVEFVDDFKSVVATCIEEGLTTYNFEKERYSIEKRLFLSYLKVNTFANAEDKLYLLVSLKWVQEWGASKDLIVFYASLIKGFGIPAPSPKPTTGARTLRRFVYSDDKPATTPAAESAEPQQQETE